jgi:hypothetical protein
LTAFAIATLDDDRQNQANSILQFGLKIPANANLQGFARASIAGGIKSTDFLFVSDAFRINSCSNYDS